MAQQKKGLITRLLEGKEKSEEYARSTLPTNRWQLFWDIFKGNFGKIVKVNLLVLLFCVPTIMVILFGVMFDEANSVTYPFGANLTVGYPAYPDQQGISELLNLQGDMMVDWGLLISMFIASVGLAGGLYVIRNMVWTEGIFVANDFWRGVKLNYKNALQTTLFYGVILLLSVSLINFAEMTLALGDVSKWQRIWMRISQGTSYILIVMGGLMSLWMIAQGVNYKVTFFNMLKNSFLIMIGTLPQTIFFGALALLPFLLFLFNGSFFIAAGVIILLLFGLAYALLVWLDFAQWVFDKYINPKIQGARVGRGIYSKEDGSSQEMISGSGAEIEYRRTLLAQGRSRLVARPIKPIDDSLQVYELPQAFTREDLKRLKESKQNIAEDSELYAEEHKNDLRYVEYNQRFDELEKSFEEVEDGKKKKRKKLKPPKKTDDE
ncbi:MAG: hypothetical protein IJX87_00025 [Clostridia bacterium]|nr:hypothetical protein [Clostridia bacterium]